jgi:putative aldouronate transport system permease protein
MMQVAINTNTMKTAKAKKTSRINKSKWQLIVMISLPLVWYIIFCYVPMYGIQLAFRSYNPKLGYLGSPFVGLRYFKQFFSSYYCWDVIWNTFSISLYSLLISFPAPIILALIINELPGKRFKKVIQNITYIPHFISIVVLCGMLFLFLSPEYGVVNSLLSIFGIGPIGFLESNVFFKPVYVLSEVWQESGWNSIIYIAALGGIDPSLYEAATIDGASRFKRIWHISLPGITPTIITLLVLRIGQLMSVGFEKALLLQNDLNIGKSEIISTLVYKNGILRGELSYATAVGLMNSVLNLILIVLANKVCKKLFDNSLW